MIVYTDSVDFAHKYLPDNLDWEKVQTDLVEVELANLYNEILSNKVVYKCIIDNSFYKEPDIPTQPKIWNYLFIVKYAEKSHYDILADSCRNGTPIPGGIICLAGSGGKFHGFKNRPWVGLEGNIHLAAYLSPNQPVENYGAGFMALSAISAIQAIDSIEDLKNKAGIKWVNDILINGSKVCGVLAYAQSEGNLITGAVVGIGLNVEATPSVGPTPFVPKTASLKDFSNTKSRCNQKYVFNKLLLYLGGNYSTLCDGNFSSLLNFYRKRSIIIGKKVEIHPDSPESKKEKIITGIPVSIDNNLELYLKNQKSPITKGRLVIID